MSNYRIYAMSEENPIDHFVQITRNGFDEFDPNHLSALARLAAAASEAGCDDMGAIIIKMLMKAGGNDLSYDKIRAQFSHGGEHDD